MKSLALVTLALCVSSCVSTSLNAMTAPEFAGRRFRHVAVFACFEDLALVQSAERRACDDIAHAGGKAIPGSSLALPGSPFDDALIAKLKREQVDGLVFVGVTGSGTTAHFVPPTYHTSSSASGSATLVGNTAYGHATGRS